jgi:hypothetical protein
MFEIKVVLKIKTHILCPVTFFSDSCAIYEIMSKNVVEPDSANDSMVADCMLD